MAQRLSTRRLSKPVVSSHRIVWMYLYNCRNRHRCMNNRYSFRGLPSHRRRMSLLVRYYWYLYSFFQCRCSYSLRIRRHLCDSRDCILSRCICQHCSLRFLRCPLWSYYRRCRIHRSCSYPSGCSRTLNRARKIPNHSCKSIRHHRRSVSHGPAQDILSHRSIHRLHR